MPPPRGPTLRGGSPRELWSPAFFPPPHVLPIRSHPDGRPTLGAPRCSGKLHATEARGGSRPGYLSRGDTPRQSYGFRISGEDLAWKRRGEGGAERMPQHPKVSTLDPLSLMLERTAHSEARPDAQTCPCVTCAQRQPRGWPSEKAPPAALKEKRALFVSLARARATCGPSATTQEETPPYNLPQTAAPGGA